MTLAAKLAEERRARLAAERLLELKKAELHAANRKLGRHAAALSNEIVETRAEVATVRNENIKVKSDLTRANQKIHVAERRLWHSVETIRDGFAVFDDDGLVIANAAYLSIFDGLEEITNVALMLNCKNRFSKIPSTHKKSFSCEPIIFRNYFG